MWFITRLILTNSNWKPPKWVIYLWIGLTYAQSVSICAYFILFQLYWQAAVCVVYMAIISFFGIKMVQNIAVEKNNEYSEMTNLTNIEDVWKITRSECQHLGSFDLSPHSLIQLCTHLFLFSNVQYKISYST